MCYCPTPTLHLNLALTGDGGFLLSPQKTYSVWFISILNYGDTENVLINHLLLVIPMLYPCHYTNLCPHKPHKHAHTHTHIYIYIYIYIYIQVVPAQMYTLCCWLSLCLIKVPFFACTFFLGLCWGLHCCKIFIRYFYLARMHQNDTNKTFT